MSSSSSTASTATSAAAQFRHEPLRRKGEIRLVDVLPAGKWHDPIRCELHHATLDANPPYRALSYVGGAAATVPRPVFVDGRPLRVTANLEFALRRLRKLDQTVRLWVDDIADVAERSAQVKAIKDIYGQAHEVVVFLGVAGQHRLQDRSPPHDVEPPPLVSPPEALLSQVFAEWAPGNATPSSSSSSSPAASATARDVACLLAGLGQPGGDGGVAQVRRRAGECDERLVRAAFEGLRALATSPWWAGVWAVPAVAGARAVQVVLGDVVLPWPMLTAAAWGYRDALVRSGSGSGSRGDGGVGGGFGFAPEFDKVLMLVMVTVYRIECERRQQQRLRRDGGGGGGSGAQGGGTEGDDAKGDDADGGDGTLLSRLRAFSGCRARDERDKVYAPLLGLLGEEKAVAITPDYRLPVARVYADAAWQVMMGSKDFETLLLAGVGGGGTKPSRRRTDGLPSWVPDFGAALDDEVGPATERLELTELYKAGEGLKGHFDGSVRGYRARMRGALETYFKFGMEHRDSALWDLSRCFALPGQEEVASPMLDVVEALRLAMKNPGGRSPVWESVWWMLRFYSGWVGWGCRSLLMSCSVRREKKPSRDRNVKADEDEDEGAGVAAGKDWELPPRPAGDDRLVLHGLELDEVALVAPPSLFTYTFNPEPAYLAAEVSAALQALGRWLATVDGLPERAGERPVELLRALVSDLDYDDDDEVVRLDLKNGEATIKALFRWWSKRVGSVQEQDAGTCSTTLQPDDERDFDFDRAFWRSSQGRTFFITRRRFRYGWGPPSTRVGDRVYALPQAPVPYILRGVGQARQEAGRGTSPGHGDGGGAGAGGGAFQLVGHCFVNGLMDRAGRDADLDYVADGGDKYRYIVRCTLSDGWEFVRDWMSECVATAAWEADWRHHRFLLRRGAAAAVDELSPRRYRARMRTVRQLFGRWAAEVEDVEGWSGWPDQGAAWAARWRALRKLEWMEATKLGRELDGLADAEVDACRGSARRRSGVVGDASVWCGGELVDSASGSEDGEDDDDGEDLNEDSSEDPNDDSEDDDDEHDNGEDDSNNDEEEDDDDVLEQQHDRKRRADLAALPGGRRWLAHCQTRWARRRTLEALERTCTQLLPAGDHALPVRDGGAESGEGVAADGSPLPTCNEASARGWAVDLARQSAWEADLFRRTRRVPASVDEDEDGDANAQLPTPAPTPRPTPSSPSPSDDEDEAEQEWWFESRHTAPPLWTPLRSLDALLERQTQAQAGAGDDPSALSPACLFRALGEGRPYRVWDDALWAGVKEGLLRPMEELEGEGGLARADAETVVEGIEALRDVRGELDEGVAAFDKLRIEIW